VAQWKRIRLGIMRLQVRSLASLSGLRIWWCRELWCRPAAVALIRPLAWEPPYAASLALKRQKDKKKKKKKNRGRLGNPDEGLSLDQAQKQDGEVGIFKKMTGSITGIW